MSAKAQPRPTIGLNRSRTGRDSRDWLEAGPAARVPEELHRLAVGLCRLHAIDFWFQVAVARQQIGPAVQIVVEEE